MSGKLPFQRQTSIDAKRDKAIPVYPGRKPARPPRTGKRPEVPPGPEEFPRALSLDLPLDETNKGASDLAKFLCKVKLPQRIRIKEPFVVPGSMTSLSEKDELLLHFIYDNPTVHSTTSKGKNLRLPIYAKQEYEILPLDPRLDDKVYDGTKELVEASPLPKTVRVEEAFYAEEDEEYQVVGDIIEIEGVQHDKDRGKILVGKCGSAPIKYSTEMNSTFTTMLYPDFYHMKELKDFNFPLRVRIPGDTTDPSQRSLTQKQVLNLEKFSVDKCVVATRAGHPHIYSIPVATPIKFWQDPITIPEKHALGMLPALYPLVNMSWGLVDPTQEALPPSMQAIPQPLEQVLKVWLPSERGKSHSSTKESALKENYKARLTSDDVSVRSPYLPSERPRYYSEGGPRLPPRPPGSRKDSICSDPGSPSYLDSDSDSDMYETVPDPVGPLPKGLSKQVMATVNDILTKKEMELRKERGSMNLWKTKCKTLENEVMKLKETVASALRQKLPQPRDAESDDDYDDIDGYAYLKPIPDDWRLTRPSAPTGQKPSAASLSPQKTSNLRDFTVGEVGEFLRQHALEKYVDTFRKNGVNGALLAEMDEVHMLDLQMSRFHALKLKIEVGRRCKPPLPPQR